MASQNTASPNFISGKISSLIVTCIDASGSTVDPNQMFVENGVKITVFDAQTRKMDQLLTAQGVPDDAKIHILYWNSFGHLTNKQGVTTIPFPVEKKKYIEIVDNVVSATLKRTNDYGSTCTNFAIEKIPAEWVAKSTNENPLTIYIVTDGQMGGNVEGGRSLNSAQIGARLVDAIKNLITKCPEVQINIVTVEAVNRDFNVENNTAAGSDVYNAIKGAGLTNKIAKFVSYTPNFPQGFTQFENQRVPAGYIPYRDQCFSVQEVDVFYHWIKHKVENSTDTEELYKILGDLTKTIAAIVETKAPSVKTQIIDRFCEIFINTPIDSVVVKFLLKDSIEESLAGRAALVSQFRSSLKNLFAAADRMLRSNTRDALGITANSMVNSIPYETGSGKMQILSCPAHMMTAKYGQAFERSAVEIADQNTIIPMIPQTTSNSDMAAQCLRQWIRQIVGPLFNVSVQDDSIVYTILAYALAVNKSPDVDQATKDSYIYFARTMLDKKRPKGGAGSSIDITEREYLRQGNFDENMVEKCAAIARNRIKFGKNYRSRSIWYGMCLLIDDVLAAKQKPFCQPHLEMDYLDENFDLIIETQIEMATISRESGYEYHCLITQEDTSATGGFILKPHNNCAPNQVFSPDGLESFAKSAHFMCPICYIPVNRSMFEQIPPKPTSTGNQVQIDAATAEKYKNYGNTASSSRQQQAVRPASAVASSSNSSNNNQKINNISPRQSNNVVIWLKATVGGGKTTTRTQMIDALKANGYNVIVASMDDKNNAGQKGKAGANTIKSELQRFLNKLSTRNAVIVDTCGEQTDNNSVFGVSFSNWDKITYTPNLVNDPMSPEDWTNYQYWTLRNVLQRGASSKTTNFNLNPINAGVEICLQVHASKFRNVFPGVAYTIPNMSGSIQDMITTLTPNADKYLAKLSAITPTYNFLF